MLSDPVLVVNTFVGSAYIGLLIVIASRDRGEIRDELRKRIQPAFWRFPLPAPASFISMLPITLAVSGLLITALNIEAFLRFGRSSREVMTTVAGACFAVISLTLWSVLKTGIGRRIKGVLTRHLESPLAAAFLVSAHAAVASAIIVVYLAIYPSALGKMPVYNWEFLDKRWLLATYSFGVTIPVVLPVFLCRLFRDSSISVWRSGARLENPGVHVQATDHEIPASAPSSLNGPPRSRTLDAVIVATKVLAAIILASILATYFFDQYFFIPTQRNMVDSHELVHLASLSRIRQGHTPYVEAETQYGPGHQFLTYWLMRRTEFSLYGFRMSHLLLNLVSAIAIYTIVLLTLPWWVATLFVMSSFWVSPFLLFDFVGWGVIARWMGPFVLGACLPFIVRKQRRSGSTFIGSLVLGGAWGLLSWLASDNLASGLLTFLLVMVVFWSIQAVSVRAALEISLGLGLGFLIAWMVFFSTIHGVRNIGEFVFLYSRPTRFIGAGFSNTPWSSGSANPWFLPYIMTPYFYITLGMAAILCGRRLAQDRRRETDRLQFSAMWSAGVISYLPTMCRADSSHFIGSTLALWTLLVLAVTKFPSLVTANILAREAIRAAVAVAIVLIYPVPRSFAHAWAQLYKPGIQQLGGVREVVGFVTQRRNRDTMQGDRIGFQLDPARCCSDNNWTSRQWTELMKEIAGITAGRPTVVFDFRGTVPSAVYFFADLQVATSITEPSMSVWIPQDVERWDQQIERSDVSCLVTTSRAADKMLQRFRHYSVYERQSPVPYTIYCRDS